MSHHSNFWYDFDQDDNVDILTGEEIKPGKDYVKMAATLRAISNFVRIVTGENIPVKYNNKDESFTDGKTVVISGNIKDKDFDPTVGLALHEGSHCLLTDFNIIKENNFNQYIKNNFDIDSICKKHSFYETRWCDEKSEMISTGEYNKSKGVRYIADTLKQLLNFVEDRRIDYYIYKNAPGYQGYYEALYDKYFHSRVIDKALQSNEKTSEDLDSYMFRLINITNSNRNLKALKGLMKIWKCLDLKNIDRLKTTKDALDVATEVFNIIESNLPAPEKQEEKSGGDNDNKTSESSGNNNGSSDESKELTDEDIDNIAKQLVEDDGSTAQGSKPKSGSAAKTIELTPAQKRQLENSIKKQKQFIGEGPNKSKISKKDEKIVDAISSSGSETKEVGDTDLQDPWRHRSTGKTDCIVVKNLTKELAQAEVYDTYCRREYWSSDAKKASIQKGFLLGKMLGRKLQIRNESNTLKYTRLQKGKIDKRLISSLGFGAENVFNQTFVEQFNNSVVHLSIDASGSMSGDKFNKSLTASVAIAQAASMTNNFDVIISFRSTEDMGSKTLPAIFIAYDSRKHKVKRLSWILEDMHASGITPEGLCFQAIMNEIDSSSSNKDSFFINFSDGEPYFENAELMYYGEKANQHTKKQVDRMIAKGVKVLSYFIGSKYGSNEENFKKMYGKDASFIQSNELVPLAKSLNKMFAEK